eukprot:m.412812 g.412812  ORF g.412812 m.412812 type:complete len:1268 (+) comp56570_c0_seq2:1860-5663(+)
MSASLRWKGTIKQAQRQHTVDATLAVDEVLAPLAPIRIAALLPTDNTLLHTTITNVCLNHQLEFLSFKALKDGKTDQLDGFNNSHLLIVDMSDSASRPFISFQLGVRESLSGEPSVVIFTHKSKEDTTRMTSKRYECAPIQVLNNPSRIVVVQETEQDEMLLDDFLEMHLQKAAAKKPPEATKEVRFREAISRARSNQSNKAARLDELLHLESMLRSDPQLITPGRLMDMLLTYRDLASWDDMIRLIRAARDCAAAELPEIQYFVAFALNRRNYPGDRGKALEICDHIIKSKPYGDAYGLKGRIYKDMFIESIKSGGTKDYPSCEKAIEAYREVFRMEESLYGGVNLATLLFASEEYAERKGEIENICSILNSEIARKGGIKNCADYWDIASFFEVNVVGELWRLANQAAPAMYGLASASWMVETSMRNVQLIEKIRKQREIMAGRTGEYTDPQRLEFEFWCEFFIAISMEEIPKMFRLPALVSTTGPSRPCHITVHPPADNVEASVELLDAVQTPSQSTSKSTVYRKFPVSSIKQFELSKSPHTHDANTIDKRHISLTVVAQKGVNVMTLHFASEFTRTRFHELCLAGGLQSQQTANLVEQEVVEWEFDRINGQRKVLGQGATAKVYAAFNKATNEGIAVKELQMTQSGVAPDLEEEIRTIRHLQHRNIIKFIGFEKPNGLFRLLMEQVPGGSLTSLLEKYGPLLRSINDLVDYSQQLLDALSYLHGCDIVHRDVKGDNVLVNTYSGVLKVADFGTSKRMAGLNPRTATLAGTPWYMAPEVIQSDTHEYGRESDIWSLGCTVWQMANGRPPFMEIRDASEVMEMIGMLRDHPEIPSTWPETLRMFLLSCFKEEPSARGTADGLLQHDFIRGVKQLTGLAARRASRPAFAFQRQVTVQAPDEPTPSQRDRNAFQRQSSSAASTDQAWTSAGRRQEIIEQLASRMSDVTDELVAEWLKAIREDSTFSSQPDVYAERARDILKVFVKMLNADATQTGNRTKSLEVEMMINDMIGALGKKDTAMFDGNLKEFKKQLLLFKPDESMDAHFAFKVITADTIQIRPHWIFCIEQSLCVVGDSIMSELSVITAASANRQLSGTTRQHRANSSSNRDRSDSNRDTEFKGISFAPSLEVPVLHESPVTTPTFALPSDALAQFLSKQQATQTQLQAEILALKQTAPAPPPAKYHRFKPSVDPLLDQFVADIGLEPIVATVLAENQLTLKVLLNDVEKDDLRELDIPLGPRCTLWAAIQKQRSNTVGGSSTRSALFCK